MYLRTVLLDGLEGGGDAHRLVVRLGNESGTEFKALPLTPRRPTTTTTTVPMASRRSKRKPLIPPLTPTKEETQTEKK